MTTTTTYLAKLERALRDVPEPIALDILEGVREELRGLDDIAAADRIAELGDPIAIAAAASAEAPPRRRDAPWYLVVTTLLVAIGGFVIPVAGWVLGIGLLWNSRTWTRRDKVVGTLIVPVGLLVVVGLTMLAGLAVVPQETDLINPLVPSVFSFAHLGTVIAALVLPVASGAYLAVRARRLTATAVR